MTKATKRKPDIIYVKSFVIINDNSDNDGIKSNNTSKSACKGNNNKEFGKSEFKDSENQTSRVRKNISQEVGETVSNNTNISDILVNGDNAMPGHELADYLQEFIGDEYRVVRVFAKNLDLCLKM